MTCFQPDRKNVTEVFDCMNYLIKLQLETSRCFNRGQHFKDENQYKFKDIRDNFDLIWNSWIKLNLFFYHTLLFYVFKVFSSVISFFHCFLSIFVGIFIFVISYKCQKPHKIPVTIFSKFFSFLQNVKMFKLRRTSFEEQDIEFEIAKENIRNEIVEQQKVDW